MKFCKLCLMDHFRSRDYIYFITIKPPPDDAKISAIANLKEYLTKKNLRFWIVLCQSTSGYKHFHGIISFNEHQSPCKGAISLVQRQVNRSMGFVQLVPICGSLSNAYDYIRANNNTGGGLIDQLDYFHNYIPSHTCI